MTEQCDQCARLREALQETLELAERLSSMAEDGAGAYPNWGARVLQAVRPLRAALAAPSELAPSAGPPRAEEPDPYRWRESVEEARRQGHAAGFREGVERARQHARAAVSQEFVDKEGHPSSWSVGEAVSKCLSALVPGGEK